MRCCSLVSAGVARHSDPIVLAHLGCVRAEAFDRAYQEDLNNVEAYLSGKLSNNSGDDVVVTKEPRLTPNCHPILPLLRENLREDLSAFNQFILAAILANMFFLALDGHDANKEMSVRLSRARTRSLARCAGS